jgi:hypothetical protein
VAVPHGEDWVNRLENIGGLRVVLRRLSLELVRRYEAYSKSLRLVYQSDPEDLRTFRKLAMELHGCFPTRPPGPPEVQYNFLCAGGPLARVVTAVIVVGVLILVENEVNDDEDPPPGDDDGEPEGSDPDAGICEGELEPDAGVCTPG